MPPFVPAGQPLPEFHDDLLVVQFRPAAFPALGANSPLAPASPGMTFANAPGLSALSFYERAGMIREVVPLGLRRPRLLSPGMGPLAMASPAADESSPLSGLNLIRLEKGADGQQIRMALAQDPHVQAVSRVPCRYLAARKTPAAAAMPPGAAAVPPSATALWNLQKVRWKQAMDAGLDPAAAVHVAVLDTGIDLGHPDLPGDQITYVYDYPSAGTSTSAQDVVGHGTHVAGTIRALANNGVGINGLCECRLSAYKIFGDQVTWLPPQWGGYFTYLVDPVLYRAALAACLDAGVQVVNLSIGGFGEPDAAEKLLFQELVAANVAVVAAMGNENTSQKSYPAAIPGVIAVGSTRANDSRSNFSNFGSHIALTAPGSAIWSTLPTYPGQSGFWPAGGGGTPTPGMPMTRETDYDAWDGTSMASPHVAAAAAMAVAKYGALNAAAMKARLQQATDAVPGMNGQGFTNYYGTGRLNLMKL
ncbi:MAG: S8 family serine peptidase [Gemmataceae bacterium]